MGESLGKGGEIFLSIYFYQGAKVCRFSLSLSFVGRPPPPNTVPWGEERQAVTTLL